MLLLSLLLYFLRQAFSQSSKEPYKKFYTLVNDIFMEETVFKIVVYKF